jgi:hypothetical protein
MSDEFQQKPGDEIQQEAVADVKPNEELSPEELSKVDAGSIFPSIMTAVTEAPGIVVTGNIVSPRDAAAGLATGKRM